jgi:5-methylcytosine-specific restriction endonuclease McrA
MSHNAKVAYLQSLQWKALVAQVKARDGYKCVVTGVTTQLEVHHITYARLGDEDLSDLVTVTRKVHQNIHDKLGYNRNTLYPVSAYFS